MATIDPKFDSYDERVAEGLMRAHSADRDGLDGWLGIRLVEIWPGGLRAVLQVRPDLLNPFGMMHGGVLSCLCDHILGVVCYPVIPRGAWAATTEFKLNLLAPVSEGSLEATATILSLSKRTAVVRIEVENQDRLVCAAQGTVSVMEPKRREDGA